MCPSGPALAIPLGPTNPWLIFIAKETLIFRRPRFTRGLWLLVPTFLLPHAPEWLTPSPSQQSGILSYHLKASLIVPSYSFLHETSTMGRLVAVVRFLLTVFALSGRRSCALSYTANWSGRLDLNQRPLPGIQDLASRRLVFPKRHDSTSSALPSYATPRPKKHSGADNRLSPMS